MDVQLHERLRARIDQRQPDECWPWTGTINKKGYGQISVQRRTWLAHRLVWVEANGPIPDGLQVCHRCDNRSCCNLADLFLGTAADNQHDKRDKGRAARGEANRGGGKLTAAQVREIRILRGSGVRTGLVAVQFGVSDVLIRKIMRGVLWSHVR